MYAFFLGEGSKFSFHCQGFYGPPNLLTILEEFSSSIFGLSGLLLIFTYIFLELKLYSFAIFFPLHWKIKNFQESN